MPRPQAQIDSRRQGTPLDQDQVEQGDARLPRRLRACVCMCVSEVCVCVCERMSEDVCVCVCERV
jgi:hypothetical protein